MLIFTHGTLILRSIFHANIIIRFYFPYTLPVLGDSFPVCCRNTVDGNQAGETNINNRQSKWRNKQQKKNFCC